MTFIDKTNGECPLIFRWYAIELFVLIQWNCDAFVPSTMAI